MADICEHSVENCIYCDEHTCDWPGCPALTQAEDRRYCAVHRPDKLLERVRNVLTDRIFRAAAPLPLKYQRVLVSLEREILDDLERTT